MTPSPSPGDVPKIFSARRHAAFRERAAPGFGEYDFLKARLSSDLVERMEDSAHRFPRALDLGSHTGALSAALKQSAQVDHVTALDPSAAMAAAAKSAANEVKTGDLEAVAEIFAPGSFDMIASAMALHWVNDLPGLFVQARHLLKPDGLFLAGFFGAGTLLELREALMQAETELTGGAAPRVSPLPGLQDSAALLQRAGFALPVADIDHVTVRYDTMFHLITDLRAMGEQAAFATGGRALSRRILSRAAEIYGREFADDDGRVRASFEIVWLSGWAPAPNQPRPKRPGTARASLAEAVGSVEKSAGEKAGG